MESKRLGSLLLLQPQGGGLSQAATPKHLRKHELSALRSANFWKTIQFLFRLPRHYEVTNFEDALLNHHLMQAELGFFHKFQRGLHKLVSFSSHIRGTSSLVHQGGEIFLQTPPPSFQTASGKSPPLFPAIYSGIPPAISQK